MILDELILHLNRIHNRYGGKIPVVIRNYASLGDINLIVEPDNLVVHDKILFIE